ncbi:hypothetical protein BH10BAC5_BH10BAC5_28970 [soil metagenome]
MKDFHYTPLLEKSGEGEVGFTIGSAINASLSKVWENVCKGENLKKYFNTDTKGDLDSVGQVIWIWGEQGVVINVLEVIPFEKIVFEWNGNNVEYTVRTEFHFELIKKETIIKIKEKGWLNDTKGLKSAFANCSGWTEYLNALKVHIEYNINFLKE